MRIITSDFIIINDNTKNSKSNNNSSKYVNTKYNSRTMTERKREREIMDTVSPQQRFCDYFTSFFVDIIVVVTISDSRQEWYRRRRRQR